MRPPSDGRLSRPITLQRRSFLARLAAGGAGALAFADAAGAAESHATEQKSKPGKAAASMVFETVFTPGVAHLSYLIGDKATGRAAVIDPRRDVEVYLDLAAKHHLTITHAIETHIHADFVSGSRELADRTGTAKVYVSVEGGAQYDFDHQPLRDRSQVDLGRVILTAKHTPGHTPEHLSYLAAESNRPDDPFAIFSGDCLFADSVGRPDLLGESQTPKLAKELYRSIYKIYLGLDDDLRVHPAHGAGSPCGANIGDRLLTTIGYERGFNPALQMPDEAEFIDYVLRTAPPKPRYYPRMKKENAHGPEVLGRLPTIAPLAPDAFAETIAGGDAQLVDNRQMLAFGGGHIKGALNIGPRAELSIWAGWVLDPNRDILLILEQDDNLPKVLAQFIRVGFTRFAGYLAGGIEEWDNRGLPLETVGQVTVRQLKGELAKKDVRVVDVRTPQEWEAGHVPDARYAFLPELKDKLADIDKDQPLIVYCDSGYRASLAASILKSEGFTNVSNVPGSWKARKSVGYPVETPHEYKKASDTDR
jgi:hydroxyacylglutathione hydrolase